MKTFLSYLEFRDCIAKAKEFGACQNEVDLLYSFKTVKQFLNHPRCPFWLTWYCTHVLKDRWIEAEEIIKQDSRTAFIYARDVVKARWYDGEPAILKDLYCTYMYAIDIIKGRWIEGERVIHQNFEYSFYYNKNIESLDGQCDNVKSL